MSIRNNCNKQQWLNSLSKLNSAFVCAPTVQHSEPHKYKSYFPVYCWFEVFTEEPSHELLGSTVPYLWSCPARRAEALEIHTVTSLYSLHCHYMAGKIWRQILLSFKLRNHCWALNNSVRPAGTYSPSNSFIRDCN